VGVIRRAKATALRTQEMSPTFWLATRPTWKEKTTAVTLLKPTRQT
jgi:hypothetical protein